LTMPVQPETTQKEFTILLLGMTGVGKSTFINSIANYLLFETIDEAINGIPYCIIPTTFTLSIRGYEENEYVELNIEMLGENEKDKGNEVPDSGKSCTQAPRSYSFVQNGIKVNVIDVPGIGDTDGHMKDQDNKRAIIEKISKFPKIHSVWVMLKATESRLTIEFLYSLNDIFSTIPKSAVENISFIITHSKGSDFNPGHTCGPLKKFINDLNNDKSLEIKVNDAIFCIDSESFRFQVAYYSNEIFRDYVNNILSPEKRKQSYDSCWIESRKATMKLLNKTLKARGEPVAAFLAINRARILIPCFLNAATKVLSLIEKNRSAQFRTELKKNLMHGTDVQNDINVSKEKLPKTVCTNVKCIKWTTNSDGKKIFEFTQ
ncbi:hypothetical protein FO519_010202, partial [Halicephalobus sp. NKZ332]